MNKFFRLLGANGKGENGKEVKVNPNVQLIPTDKAINNVLISTTKDNDGLALQVTNQPVVQVASPAISTRVSQRVPQNKVQIDAQSDAQSDVQSYLQSRSQGNSQQSPLAVVPQTAPAPQAAPAIQIAPAIQTAPAIQGVQAAQTVPVAPVLHSAQTVQVIHKPQNNHASQPLIQLDNVNKAYQTPVGEFIALRNINLSIGTGEFVAVVGKSGSGKSTLINMITGIDRPTTGEIYVGNTPIHNLAEGPMAEWRGRNIGIIFQFFQLLPMLSCIENVMLPMDFCNMFKASEREARALHLLEQVDMVEHAYKLPSEVSGGQQQRVAIARALANDPPLLVADEPTGNLDSRTAEAVFQLFARMVDEGKTILMVTHDDEMAHQVRRTITLTDGQIVNQDYHTQHVQAPTPEVAVAGQPSVTDQPIVSI